MLASGDTVRFSRGTSDVELTYPGGEAHAGLVHVEPLRQEEPLLLSTDKVQNRAYGGSLDIESRPREVLVVNLLPVEEFVQAVTLGELPAAWPKEALKAQAVVARTYMARNVKRHRKDGYDFCDLAHCQVYKGRTSLTSEVADIIAKTQGEILADASGPVDVYFHAVCGGHTAASTDVWGGESRPYLRGVSDIDLKSGEAYCRASPDFRWSLDILDTDLGELLRAGISKDTATGAFQSFDILHTSPEGWVKTVAARFERHTETLTGFHLYLLWGRKQKWHQLKSGFFTLKHEKGHYRFAGRGLGHGIGLCQWGAYGRAQAGRTYRDILSAYFPNTRIER